MMRTPETVLITGATGLVGRGVLQRMLANNPELRAYALVRDPSSWGAESAALGSAAERVTPINGDVTRRGLGIEYRVRHALTREVSLIVHAAADTSFSRSLCDARRVNTEGTRELLKLARAFGKLRRFSYISTAYVAGRTRGVVLERDNGDRFGWVNAYERSKHEAECLVRASSTDWVIFRPSTIVCDTALGSISQLNAVHRALRIYNRGLAAMMPGHADDCLDMVPADYVSDAVARVTVDGRATGKTLHLCAGKRSIRLGELLDSAYELWASDPAWRKRGVERAVLTDLATYTLFADAVIETGDQRLAAILSSLSHFIPQLALPKQFDTTVADSLVGYSAPQVSSYWPAIVAELMLNHWGSRVAA